MTYEEKLRLVRMANERPERQSMRLAMTLALNTTMRSSEVRALRWRDINLLEKSLTVRRSKTGVGERVIPLNDGALAAVLELRERTKHLFGEAIEPGWYLFPWNADQSDPDPLRPVGSWRRAWRKLTISIRCPLSVTLLQAREMTGLSRHTLCRYVHEGIIRGARVGRLLLIPTSELERITKAKE